MNVSPTSNVWYPDELVLGEWANHDITIKEEVDWLLILVLAVLICIIFLIIIARYAYKNR